VTIAKRTREYRRYRPALRSLLPADVWADEDHACFVFFPLQPARPGTELLLGFVVDADARAVRSVSPVTVRLTANSLIAENMSTETEKTR
jgi:hypothetical protein